MRDGLHVQGKDFIPYRVKGFGAGWGSFALLVIDVHVTIRVIKAIAIVWKEVRCGDNYRKENLHESGKPL